MPFQYQPGSYGGSKANNSSGINLLLSLLTKQSPGSNQTGMLTPVDPGIATGENIGEITAGPNFNYVPAQVDKPGGLNGY